MKLCSIGSVQTKWMIGSFQKHGTYMDIVCTLVLRRIAQEIRTGCKLWTAITGLGLLHIEHRGCMTTAVFGRGRNNHNPGSCVVVRSQ